MSFPDYYCDITVPVVLYADTRKWWNHWVETWDRVAKHYAVDAHLTCPCTECGRVYDVWQSRYEGAASAQGDGVCAWSCYVTSAEGSRWVIHCGYGSDFDLSEFWYIDQFPKAPADPICDWCIRRMLRNGVIIDSGKELSIG